VLRATIYVTSSAVGRCEDCYRLPLILKQVCTKLCTKFGTVAEPGERASAALRFQASASAGLEGGLKRSRILRGMPSGERRIGTAREFARVWREDGWKLQVVAQGACNRVFQAEMRERQYSCGFREPRRHSDVQGNARFRVPAGTHCRP